MREPVTTTLALSLPSWAGVCRRPSQVARSASGTVSQFWAVSPGWAACAAAGEANAVKARTAKEAEPRIRDCKRRMGFSPRNQANYEAAISARKRNKDNAKRDNCDKLRQRFRTM